MTCDELLSSDSCNFVAALLCGVTYMLGSLIACRLSWGDLASVHLSAHSLAVTALLVLHT